MKSKKYAQYLIGAIRSAIKAGDAIMEVYQSDFAVETKEDKSPLTLADKKAHNIIKADLEGYGIPFISEEGRSIPYETRKTWHAMWVVDPLDGTKEFIKRNGEFTVNIAIVENHRPVLGVVYAPVKQWLYFASRETGAFKIDLSINLPEFNTDKESVDSQLVKLMSLAAKLPTGQQRDIYTIVGSRSHGTEELDAFVAQKKEERGDVAFIAAGSSLKICLVAEGSADIYPRLGPTMEWDTAAGQAVAECSGATIKVHETSKALEYNKADLLNPWFVVER